MKKSKLLFGIALVSIMSAAFFSCGETGPSATEDDGTLKGTITIQNNYGQDITEAYAGDMLVAAYTGTETVNYQWQRQLGSAPYTNVGANADSYMPSQEGSYTVTVSAPGKTPITSAPVTVTKDPDKQDLTGHVLFFIDDGVGDPVTTSETGQEITALYEGSETATTDVAYQWFKGEQGEQPVQAFADMTNDKYTPTEPGSYTVTITASGYNPFVSDPIEVDGQALLTITFDLNGAGGEDPVNPTIIIAPGTPMGTLLPSAPQYNGFEFAGWYTLGGQRVTETTTFSDSITVYARWNFGGGIAYQEQDDLAYGGYIVIHPNPKVNAVSNATVSTVDGTITLNRPDNNTRGMIRYSWPTGTDFSIGDYVYCDVDFEIISYTPGTGSDPKAGTGIQLRLPDDSAAYPGVANNNPWLTNLSSTGIRFTLSGAGDKGGFAIRSDGVVGGSIVFRITKITFYKVELFTVSFALDGAENPTSIADVEVYDGYTLTFTGASLTSKFPTPPPTKTGYKFTGWKNAAGTTVTATTPITGNWTLTAQWIDDSAALPVEYNAPENGTLFSAVGDYSSAVTYTHEGKSYWIVADNRGTTWQNSPIAPFDATTAAAIQALQAGYNSIGYTRLAYDLSATAGWDTFTKVTITYDVLPISGTGFSVVFRDSKTAAGGADTVESAVLTNGANQTKTFDISKIKSGGLSIVKNADTSGLLMRITKVVLHFDD